jgi:hypothetical protein
VQGEGQNSYDIWVLPLKGDSKPFPFLRTPADEHEGAFSPNGRWVAYVSNETGSFEIFVRPFPPSNRGKWLVSKGMVGSTLPGWRKDGKELTYIDRDANMTSVTVTQDSVFQPGEPTPLFKVPSVMLGALPDRNAFLAGMPIGAAASTSKYLTVVLNWQSGLKK